jgi:hypothetical protein
VITLEGEVFRSWGGVFSAPTSHQPSEYHLAAEARPLPSVTPDGRPPAHDGAVDMQQVRDSLAKLVGMCAMSTPISCVCALCRCTHLGVRVLCACFFPPPPPFPALDESFARVLAERRAEVNHMRDSLDELRVEQQHQQRQLKTARLQQKRSVARAVGGSAFAWR